MTARSKIITVLLPVNMYGCTFITKYILNYFNNHFYKKTT